MGGKYCVAVLNLQNNSNLPVEMWEIMMAIRIYEHKFTRGNDNDIEVNFLLLSKFSFKP
jgi:hypothetical protein